MWNLVQCCFNVLNALFAPRLCRCIFHFVELPYLMLSYLLPQGKNTKEAGWVERNTDDNPQSSLSFKCPWVVMSFKNCRWSLNRPENFFICIILQIYSWRSSLSNELKWKQIQIFGYCLVEMIPASFTKKINFTSIL